MDSFIGWVGGKKALRYKILERFPKDQPQRYIEVFGGAGWVLFAKEKVKQQIEVYNDVDSNLVNLYRCIQNHLQEFKRQLECVPTASELFYDYKEQLNIRGLTDIQKAVRYFYLIKASFGCKKDSFATRPKTFDTTLERLTEITERLNGVIIENGDFEKLIKVYYSNNTLFYLDPPYFGTESYYKNNAETFSYDDHIRLKNCLYNIKGKFILSYNDDEFIQELYKDYHIDRVERKNLLPASGNSKDYGEVIVKNY